MGNVPITLVMRNYDAITPLIAGDVTVAGVDLRLDRETPMARFATDLTYQAGEMSLAQYVKRIAAGDHAFIGLPIFVARGFRQRCFLVRQDSDLDSLADLAGTRIGIDSWGATGHTWNRSLLREAGVAIEGIQWVIGPPEDATGQAAIPTNLPSHARPAPAGVSLVELLLAGEIDALIMSQPPRAFYQVNSPVRRLLRHYREVEAAYAARVGFWPPFHIIGLRASVAHEHPWLISELFTAFDASQKLAAARRLNLADTAPWLLDDLESVAEALGPDWQSHGVEPNRTAIATFCEEMHLQGLISDSLDPALVFGEFEAAMTRDGVPA